MILFILGWISWPSPTTLFRRLRSRWQYHRLRWGRWCQCHHHPTGYWCPQRHRSHYWPRPWRSDNDSHRETSFRFYYEVGQHIEPETGILFTVVQLEFCWHSFCAFYVVKPTRWPSKTIFSAGCKPTGIPTIPTSNKSLLSSFPVTMPGKMSTVPWALPSRNYLWANTLTTYVVSHESKPF